MTQRASGTGKSEIQLNRSDLARCARSMPNSMRTLNNMGNDWNILLELNNPDRVSFPSQNISGRVILNLEKSVECTNLFVHFVGEGEVTWSVHRSGSNVKGSYCANEEYINSEIIPKESDMGTTKITLPSGKFSYPFNFPLPANLPSSFNSSIGRITCSITARIKRPWYRYNHEGSQQPNRTLDNFLKIF